MDIGNLNLSKRFRKSGFPRLISDLFNPLFIPPLVIGILSSLLDFSLQSISWMVFTALLLYTLIPLGASLYLLRIHKITSLDLPERKSRDRMFLISIFCAFIAFLIYFSAITYSHYLIVTISFIFFLNSALGYLINLKWKISMHSAALATAGAIFLENSIASIPAVVFGMDIFSLIILFLLLPLMIWSRYRLEIHSLAELLGGAVTGFLLTIIELNILTYIW